jgi:hypothetical protein
MVASLGGLPAFDAFPPRFLKASARRPALNGAQESTRDSPFETAEFLLVIEKYAAVAGLSRQLYPLLVSSKAGWGL